MSEWINAAESLPSAGDIVLVMSESWSRPSMLQYQEFPHQRFLDAYLGKWFWYPERMKWMEIPDWEESE